MSTGGAPQTASWTQQPPLARMAEWQILARFFVGAGMALQSGGFLAVTVLTALAGPGMGFTVGTSVVTEAGGIRVGDLLVGWPAASLGLVPLSIATLIAIARLARRFDRPAIVVAGLWFVLAIAVSAAAFRVTGFVWPQAVFLALLVAGTWPEARRLLRR